MSQSKRENNMENKIGKKVWLLDGTLQMGFRLKSKDIFIVKEVKDGRDCNDWANHYIIEKDGKSIEVREFQCIFVPTETDDELTNIYNYLKENGAYPSDVYKNGEDSVSVQIDWGDWKHEHRWCNDLMRYLGYTCGDEVVTEENGSDCYSATHYFYKI